MTFLLQYCSFFIFIALDIQAQWTMKLSFSFFLKKKAHLNYYKREMAILFLKKWVVITLTILHIFNVQVFRISCR